MRRIFKLISCVMSIMICATTLVNLVGCGRKIENSAIYDDPNVPNIYYYYYDGDGEKTWLFDAAIDFNKTIEGYEIIPFGTLNEEYALNLVANGGDASIMTMTHSDIDTLVDDSDIVDLSDVLTKDVDGNGVTLENKFHNIEELKALYSTNTRKGMYGVPLSYSPMHLIFDFDLFKSKGWLIYQKDASGAPIRDESGNLVLSVGHDGVAGTYDDGQPINMQEWDEMLERIKIATNTKAFIYTTKYSFYIEPLVSSLIAQYGGLDEFVSILSGYGSYTTSDGNTVDVSIENGYEMYNAPSLLKAMEFMKKYIINKDYVHERCWNTSGLTHDDAMKTFVTGYREEIQQAAFLIEGNGFETTLSSYFSQLEEVGDDGRGYGDREYRFMLLPHFGEESISYLTSQSVGTVVVSADSNADKVKISKDFVAYTLQDKYLQQYTLDTGSVRPLTYKLTGEQESKLTPFQKTSIAIQQDKEHVKVISAIDTAIKDPEKNGLITFKGVGYQYTASFSNGNVGRVLEALMNHSPQDYVEGIYKFRKETMWGIK